MSIAKKIASLIEDGNHNKFIYNPDKENCVNENDKNDVAAVVKSDLELVTFIIPNGIVEVTEENIEDTNLNYILNRVATKDGDKIKAGDEVVWTWTYNPNKPLDGGNNIETHDVDKRNDVRGWRSIASSVLEDLKEGDKFTFIFEGVEYTSVAQQAGHRYSNYGPFEKVLAEMPVHKFM